MLNTLITIIEEHLLPLGGIGVFLASLIEEVISFIPSPLIQVSAGFFLLPESVSAEFFLVLLFQIMIPVAAGVTLGSLVLYSIGYWSGRPLLERWGQRVGLQWDTVERVRSRFQNTRTDVALLFFLRVVPLFPAMSLSAVSGLVRMRPIKYITVSFLGLMVRSAILAPIGWQVGELYREYYTSIERFESTLVVVSLLTVMLVWLYHLLRRRFRR